MQGPTRRVAIAGAGVGGLTLAAALQAQDCDVVVLERHPETSTSGTAISIWPNALAVLDTAGLGDAVRSRGRELASVELRKLNGRPALTIASSAFRDALGEGLVCTQRHQLLAALGDSLAPGTIRFGREVAGYDQTDQGVAVRLADGELLSVDAPVGADGIRSAVAAQLAGPPQFSYSGYTAWRGIADFDPSPGEDRIGACLGGGHEFGWLPLPDGLSYWFATAWVPERHRFAEGDQAYLQQTFGTWPDPVPRLLAATAPDELIRNDIVDRSLINHWSAGPVTLLGDAVHPMRPHLGQGGCQAIEDAVCLAGCLGSHSAPAAAFLAYEQRRRRRTHMMVRRSVRARISYPAGWRTRVLDGALSITPRLSVLRLEMQAVAGRMVGYGAGKRAVS